MAYSKTNWVNNTTPINETNLNKIESGIKNNDINIGEENYDNTKTYEVGDIVRYNEKIYKCITAITTAENFDISKWEQTNIVEIVQSEKSKIYELIEAISTPIVGEGENITLNDTAEKRFENFDIEGNSEQEATPSPDYPSEVESCGDNGSINEVICNKNLFDKNTTTDGKLISSSGSIQSELAAMCSDYIQIKTNINYYITGRSEWASVALYDKNKTFLERISTTQPNGVLNITNSNCKYIIINALLTDKDTLQIEEGSTATEYEQHEEQSYIMPVQQEMLVNDYLDYDNEEEVHTWGKKILDGTEEINLHWDVSDKHGYRIAIDNIKKTTSSADKSLIISNSYKAYIQDDLFKLKYKAYGISNRYNNSEVIIRNDDITTVADFKANLKSQYDAETPVIVYYKLQTPTRLKFTDEQKAVAKKLNNAKTYKGVTHIYSNDAVSPNCYVEAVKDLTTLIQ